MNQFEEKTTAFISWLEAKGVHISPKVELADLRDQNMGRGLRIKQGKVESQEQLFSIPATLLFYTGVSPEIEALTRKHDLDEWSALIVTMMALQGTPEWAPYFDILPTEFNTPMFWDPKEAAKLLSPSGLLNRIGRDAADTLYEELAQSILQESVFTNLPKEYTSRESFHRFGSIIMAYAFDVPNGQRQSASDAEEDDAEEDEEDDEVPTTKVLIPLADMINEGSNNANVEFKQGDLSTGLTCLSTKALESGQQALLARTNIASGEMLRRFGYVDSTDRSVESVDISLELIKACAARLEDPKLVDAKLDRLEEYMEELPDVLEPAVIEEKEDKQLNYDDDLLLIVAALVAPEVKKKYLKHVVDDFTERQIMTAETKALLHDVLSTRRNEYGNVSKPSGVSTRQEMAQYVLWSECCALEGLLEGLKSINTEGTPPSKRAKTA